jgi:hypothetical protein
MVDIEGEYFRLASKADEKLTMNAHGGTKRGAKVKLWDDKNANSLWKFLDLGDGTFRLEAKNS